MNRGELRHRLISALLQAEEPLDRRELAAACQADGVAEFATVLQELVEEGTVAAGGLVPGRPGPQYRWAARWAEDVGPGRAESRRSLRDVVAAQPQELAIDSAAVRAFHEYIIREYGPPRDKRFLVFFQCSVRRPFSKSPSHASMRRAVAVATGHDPARDFERCPVHVVVLASHIGPVPYELEDLYPANVRGGGVKHFQPDHFARVKPVLAARLAEYLAAHGHRYRRMAAFTEGRYAEVMAATQAAAGVDFPVFPQANGPRVVDMAGSRPRTYWAKYWIQLYLEMLTWLTPAAREHAEARLRELEVTFR